jgi:flagellar assembly protein FliH
VEVTNLSRVIKKTGDFVPEDMVPQKGRQSPIWQRPVKPENKFRVLSYHNNAIAKTAPGNANPTVDSAPSEKLFDTDFTAPDNSQVTTENQTVSDNEMVEIQPDPVDLEALKEEYFQIGLQAGIERSESDYGSTIRATQTIFEQLSSIRETIFSNSMEEMQNLVLKIAEKIIRQSVAEKKQTIINTVEEAIQQAVKSDEFVISVNPADYDIIKSRSSDFINSLSGLENIILKANPAIEQGGCLIESNNCTVDATITSQLQMLTEKIKSK